MLTFDEAFESLPSDGWLSKPEARLLWDSVLSVPHSPVLEVGCYMGRSTCLLAATGRMVYCVDPWADGFHDALTGDEIHERFQGNLKSRKIRNVRVFRQYVEDWTPLPCGAAYLDGDHSPGGTRSQIVRACFCKPSVIAVHDVNDSGDGLLIRDMAVSLLGPWKERVERLAVWDLR